jgi:hypothetical protein
MLDTIRSALPSPIEWTTNRIDGWQTWYRNPHTNGKIRVPPLFRLDHRQSIANRSQSLILVPLHRGLAALESVGWSELFGRAAHAIRAGVRTATDLYSNDYRYIRPFLGWSAEKGGDLLRGAIGAAKSALKSLR